jgi:hypothetical protein
MREVWRFGEQDITIPSLVFVQLRCTCIDTSGDGDEARVQQTRVSKSQVLKRPATSMETLRRSSEERSFSHGS